MRKLFKTFAFLLVFVLITGTIPVQAKKELSMPKELVLYVDGSKGQKEDGTRCEIGDTQDVSALIQGFKSSTMKVTLSCAKNNVVKIDGTKIKAVGIGTADVNVTVSKKTTGKTTFSKTLKVIVKKNATKVTAVGIADCQIFQYGQTISVSLPTDDDTDLRALAVDVPDDIIIEADVTTRTWKVTFLGTGYATFTAIAYQSEEYPVATCKESFMVKVNPTFVGPLALKKSFINTGRSDNAVPVTMTANKAAQQSSVPASVKVCAKVEVVFKKGVEGSTITKLIKAPASVEIINNQKGSVEYPTPKVTTSPTTTTTPTVPPSETPTKTPTEAPTETPTEAPTPQVPVVSISGGGDYYLNDSASPITSSLSGNYDGEISYQWFKKSGLAEFSDDFSGNSGETAISGATSSSYTPSTSECGFWIYYVKVTNTCSGSSLSGTSNEVSVIVEPKPATIRWNANGGKWQSDSGDKTELVHDTTVGSALGITVADPIRDGYRFVGWSYSSSGSVITLPDVIPDNGLSFYAIWEQE